MTIHEARLIRELKKRATYRRLAEIYYPENTGYNGNQLMGSELCDRAFKVLYPELEMHKLYFEEVQDTEFKEENKSYIGDFFWWE